MIAAIARWLALTVFPFLEFGTFLCISIWIAVLGPLCFFRRTRSVAAHTLVWSSWYTGIAAWVYSFLLTYTTLGTVGVVLGLLIAGVGILPMALVGAIAGGRWWAILDWSFAAATVLVPRFLGLWLIGRWEAKS